MYGSLYLCMYENYSQFNEYMFKDSEAYIF